MFRKMRFGRATAIAMVLALVGSIVGIPGTGGSLESAQAASASLSGTIVLPAGVNAQFNQLRVTATPGYGNGSDVTVVPDSNLKFNFTNLVAGTNYRISITDHQKNFPDSWWKSNSSTMGFWTNSSEIKAGSTTSITLRPAKSASISGSIVVPSWAKLSDYKFTVSAGSFNNVGKSAVANANGKFTISGLIAGEKYMLSLWDDKSVFTGSWIANDEKLTKRLGDSALINAGTNGIVMRPGVFPRYNQLVPSADLTGDKYGDLIAIDDFGMDIFPGKADGSFGAAKLESGGWQKSTVYAPGDFDGDGKADVLTKDREGILWFYPGLGGGKLGNPTKAGWGWTGLEIIPAGDVTGDGIADVLAINAKGELFYYAGDGQGGFKGKLTKNGQGWTNFDLYPAGDINGDGRSDILSIDSSGRLFTHLGKGNGFFAKSYQSGQGWGGYELFAGADINGDQLADLYSRDERTKKLFFYAGRPGGGFRTAVEVPGSW